MITVTSNGSPEPEQPKSWEDMVQEYRKSHNRALTRVASVTAHPIMQATNAFKAVLAK